MDIEKKNIVLSSGVEISYTHIHGDQTKTPMVFLHGWGGSKESFTPLIEAYERVSHGKHGDIYAIDFPGFGESPIPPTSWSIEEYASCVAQYLDTLQISSIHLVSHSFGGRVSAVLLAEHPRFFRSATFIAPAGIYHQSKKALIVSLLATPLRCIERMPLLAKILHPLRTVLRKLLGAHDYAEVDGVMKATFERVIHSDTTMYLSKIIQPTHLFFGRNDTYVPVSDASLWTRLIPQAHMTILENGRHGLQYTHADVLAEHLSATL